MPPKKKKRKAKVELSPFQNAIRLTRKGRASRSFVSATDKSKPPPPTIFFHWIDECSPEAATRAEEPTPLLVMNSDGEWQPARSFFEHLQQVLVEICAFRIELAKLHKLWHYTDETSFWQQWDSLVDGESDDDIFEQIDEYEEFQNHFREGAHQCDLIVENLHPALNMTLPDISQSFADFLIDERRSALRDRVAVGVFVGGFFRFGSGGFTFGNSVSHSF